MSVVPRPKLLGAFPVVWQHRRMGFEDDHTRLTRDLGISPRAAHIYLTSEVIDLHIESFSWTRSFGYSLTKRHSGRWNRALLFGQADFPRLIEARLAAGIYSITANPLRPAEDRLSSFSAHLSGFSAEVAAMNGSVGIAESLSDYRKLRAAGAHAAFVGVQGANALPTETDALASLLPQLVKVSLLHLTSNEYGRTSTGLSLPRRALSPSGARFIEQLEDARVLVDLAHIHPEAVSLGLSVMKRPPVVSHTAMTGVHRHFRNLDDVSARAVADRGGLIGIIYHSLYLGDGLFHGKLSSLVRHIEHALNVAGEEHVALGSDWDGLICTPRDMRTCLELPKLVDALLEHGVEERIIRKILGANFLRLLGEVRP